MKHLLSLINLDIRYQDTVTVTVDGPDEDAAAEEIQAFLKKIFKTAFHRKIIKDWSLGRVLLQEIIQEI